MKKISKIFLSLAVTFTLGVGLVYAAPKSVKQDAFYDTFVFIANGQPQQISNIALKPFIANSRVYVPVRTLQDLGIANLEWTPQSGNVSAVLSVSPAQGGGISAEKFDALSQTNSELLAKNNQLTQEVEKLKKDLEIITKENTDLKILKKEADEKSSRDNYKDSKVQDVVYELQRTFNRNRSFNEINVNGKYMQIAYQVTYRRDFDIDMIIKGLTKEDIDFIKKNDRQFIYLLEDIQSEIEREFKDKKIYFNIYNNDTSSTNKIGNYDINERGRLTGSLN